jgi:ACR3 family arsenite efflux pump ArsB
MLYGVMLEIPVRRILDASKNMGFISLSIAVNFLFVPLFAWWLSTRFVSEPALLLGLLMYFVMPCTDWFLTFTNSARGDVALGTVLVPINLALQITLLPFYLLIFMGNSVPLNPGLFFRTLLMFLLIPLSLAVISRRWGRRSFNRIISKAQAAFLGVVVAVMFASQGGLFLEKLDMITVVLIPLLGFFFCMYILSNLLRRLLKLENKEAVLLNFTTSARNSPIALAIALGAFPSLPLAAAVIAIAPIIEIPILAIQARILRI